MEPMEEQEEELDELRRQIYEENQNGSKSESEQE
jgi:hypothetical protein